MPPTLLPQQRTAVDNLRDGCILNGGVGSGKSITSIVYYLENHKPAPLFIITTAKKRDSLEWDQELAKFAISKHEPCQITVTIDSWNNIKKYVDVVGGFFIFDEQHLVGNGQWVNSFYKIVKNNTWILLTATPADTWSDYVPVFKANGFIKNKTDFEREYCVFNRFTTYPQIERYIGTKKLEHFRDQILVDLVVQRGTIRHTVYVPCGYSKFEVKLLNISRWNHLEDKPIEQASEYFSVLRRIIYLDPSRIDALYGILDHHPKSIIFYNYDFELDALRRSLAVLKGTVAEYNGHKHEPIPNTDSWYYLVQYNSGCEGWNCTETDTVVFFSQSYSYRQTEQAMGRIDRVNTPHKNLWYYFIRSNAKYELAVSRALKNKKKFNETSWYRKTFK